MTVELAGLWDWISSEFERYFSASASVTGGWYCDLARDPVWGVLLSGSTVLAEMARALHRPLPGTPPRAPSAGPRSAAKEA